MASIVDVMHRLAFAGMAVFAFVILALITILSGIIGSIVRLFRKEKDE